MSDALGVCELEGIAACVTVVTGVTDSVALAKVDMDWLALGSWVGLGVEVTDGLAVCTWLAL